MKPLKLTHQEKHDLAMAQIVLCREDVAMRFRILMAQGGYCRIEHGKPDCMVRQVVPMKEAQ